MTGAELKNGILALEGATVTSENLSNSQETRLWNGLALKYSTVDDFLSGVGIDKTEGGSATITVSVQRDNIYITTSDGNRINIKNNDPEQGYPTGYTVVKYNGNEYAIKVNRTFMDGYTPAVNFSFINRYGEVITSDYYGHRSIRADSIKSWSIGIFTSGNDAYLGVSMIAHDWMVGEDLESNAFHDYTGTTYLGPASGTLDGDHGSVTITVPAQGGGGGPTFTLHFEATSGQSGGHTDLTGYDPDFPLDTAWPIDQVEQTAYGSGGIGGFGGGGGAGGAETVIYDFSTERADNVEEIAKAHRHGYGSGGGKGGKAGDGCIIVFY